MSLSQMHHFYKLEKRSTVVNIKSLRILNEEIACEVKFAPLAHCFRGRTILNVAKKFGFIRFLN